MNISLFRSFFQREAITLDSYPKMSKTATYNHYFCCHSFSIIDLKEDPSHPVHVFFLEQLKKFLENLTTESELEIGSLYIENLSELPCRGIEKLKDKVKFALDRFIAFKQYLNIDSPSFLKRNKSFVLRSIEKDYKSFNYADLSLKKDKAFILDVLKVDATALRYADKEILKDLSIGIEAIKIEPSLYHCLADEIKFNKSLLLHLIPFKTRMIYELPQELQKDHDLIKKTLSCNPDYFLQLSKEDQTNIDYIREALLFEGSIFSRLDDKFQNDDVFINEWIMLNPFIYSYLSDEKKQNIDYIHLAVCYSDTLFHAIPEKFKSDIEFVRSLLFKKPEIIRYLPHRLIDDETFIRPLLMQAPHMLEFAGARVKGNKELILNLIKENPRVLQFASLELRSCWEVVMEAVKINGMSLAFADLSLKKDKQIAQSAIKSDGKAFLHVDSSLKKDPELILSAYKSHPSIIESLSFSELPADDFFIARCFILNPIAFTQYFSEILDRDEMTLSINIAFDLYYDFDFIFKKHEKLVEYLKSAISFYKDTHLRDFLAKQLFCHQTKEEKKQLIRRLFAASVTILDEKNQYSPLSEAQKEKMILPMISLIQAGLEPDVLKWAFAKLKAHFKELKCSRRLQIFLHFMEKVSHKELPAHFKRQMLEAVFENKSDFSISFVTMMNYFSALAALDIRNLLNLKSFSVNELKKALIDKLYELNLIDPDIHLEKRLEETFLSSRSPDSLFVYISKLKESKEMLEVIKLFIAQVLSDNIREFRNQTHFHRFFLSYEQKKAWELSLTADVNYDEMIIDTDDWEDLFLSGTEIAGSCQRVDGNPMLTRCLLGFVLDGKCRMIAYKNKKDQKIIARAFLKLMIDQNNQPALLIEPTYPTSKYQNKIQLVAKEKAALMDVSLYALDDELENNEHELRSLGSVAPFEYEDSDDIGIKAGGMFSVSVNLL